MFSAPPLTPVVKKLIIALFACFVTQVLIEFVRGSGNVMFNFLALDPRLTNPLLLLQMFSYVFVTDPTGLARLLFSLVFMWLIMSRFESTFGARHTIWLSVVGTLGGSVAALLAALVAKPLIPLYGSTTITYAGMVATAQVMAGRSMSLFGLVNVTSRQLIGGLIVLALLEFLISRDHVMFAALLGSMLAGGGYVKYMSRAPRRSSPPKRPGGTRFRVLRGGGGGTGGSSAGGNGDSDRPKWLN